MSVTVSDLKLLLESLPDDMEVYTCGSGIEVKSVFCKPKVTKIVSTTQREHLSLFVEDKKTKLVLLFHT